MLEAYVVILCNSYSMNKVATGILGSGCGLRDYADSRWALRPGRRLRSRLSLSEIRCGESARGSVLEVNEASGPCGEFSSDDRSEYQSFKIYLRHNYDSTWRAIRACANAYLASYYSPRSRGKERLDTLLRHTTMDDRELGWQTRLVPKPLTQIFKGGSAPLLPALGGAAAPPLPTPVL